MVPGKLASACLESGRTHKQIELTRQNEVPDQYGIEYKVMPTESELVV